jgi:hypothetical protein
MRGASAASWMGETGQEVIDRAAPGPDRFGRLPDDRERLNLGSFTRPSVGVRARSVHSNSD